MSAQLATAFDQRDALARAMLPPTAPLALDDGRRVFVRNWSVAVAVEGEVIVTITGVIAVNVEDAKP